MIKITKRHTIKVPKNVILYYSKKHKALILLGHLKKILIKLKVKILTSKKIRVVKITKEPFLKMAQNKKRRFKSIQGTFAALIKQTFNEITTLSIKKMKLVGVGYKAFLVKISKHFLLKFKLGYSHFIYFQIPKSIKVFCLKANSKIYISGNLYSYVSQIASLLRSFRIPEPYKGKGILYSNECIILKEGKKL
uniref:ribosomal protein L6 n=1 Tax=Odontella aurita TaxID=265563 RepID=UPI002027D7FE|nr:ribosomal protein L6 [Odontella aurita]QYB22946.1 ribosomal protein L6 [Odontella aurita]